MTTQNIDIMQLLNRLSTMEERLNMSYTKHIQHQISNNKKTNFSGELETYAPLLYSIDLDLMYATLRFRCDKDLYDRYKSRREKNGSYYVNTEDRLELARRLFSDYLDEEKLAIIANSEFMSPYDCRTFGMKSNIISNEMIDRLSYKIKIDDEAHILYYKDGEEFKEIRNYSDADFADFLVEPIFSSVDPANVRSALKRFKRFIANRMSAKG